MSQLSTNTTDLQAILAQVNALPDEKKIQDSKSVTPTTSQQTVTPDSGYDGLSQVTVSSIPSQYQDVTTPLAELNSVNGGTAADTISDAVDNTESYTSTQENKLDELKVILQGKAAGEDVSTETAEYTELLTDLETAIDTLPNAGSGGTVETCTLSTGADHSNSMSICITVYENNEITSLKETVLGSKNRLISENVVKGSLVYAAASINSCTGMTPLDNPVAFRVDGDVIFNSYPCFVKDTMILLADGTTKLVQDVEYNDILLVWDFDKGCQSTARPVWIKKVQTATYYYKCSLSNGTELRLVGSNGKCHRLFDIEKGRFESATDCVGRRVSTKSGEAIVERCEVVGEEVEFFNIITHTHLNLYAESVLTSCRLNNIYPIKNMRFVKENRAKKNRGEYPNISSDMFRGLRIAEQAMSKEEIDEYVARLYALMDYKMKYYLFINNQSIVLNEKEYHAHFGEKDIRQYVSGLYHSRITVDKIPMDVQERVVAVVNNRVAKFGKPGEVESSNIEASGIIGVGEGK